MKETGIVKPNYPSGHLQPVKPMVDDVTKSKRNYRKLAYPLLAIAYIIQWLFVLIGNLAEVIANSFEELSIFLENFITQDAAKKPVSTPESATDKGS